jgi:hypothetical protein
MEVTMLKPIKVEVAKSGQNVNYCEVLDFGKRRIRIHIRSNSYQDQCHAKVEVWNDEWKFVDSIDPGVMQTPKGLYSAREKPVRDPFLADRDELLRVAQAVLT